MSRVVCKLTRCRKENEMLTIWRNAAKQKFDQLSASDQRAVLIMLAAIISAVVYLSVFV